MPIFDFKCNKCGKIFEIVKVSTKQIIRCSCGSTDAERLFTSSVSFRLISHPDRDVAPWFTERYLAKKKKRKRWGKPGITNDKTRDSWYNVRKGSNKK